MTMNKQYHLWTKSDIKKVTQLWDSKDTKELASEIGVSVNQISYIAKVIRTIKPDLLPKKHKKGYIFNLVKEALG